MKEYPTRPLLVVCGAMSPSFMIRLEYFNMDFLIHLKCSIGRLAYVTYRSISVEWLIKHMNESLLHFDMRKLLSVTTPSWKTKTQLQSAQLKQ